MLKKIFGLSAFKIGLLVTALFFVLGAYKEITPLWSAFFEGLEYKSLDAKFRTRGLRKPPGDVVIIAIDERSQREYGLWPWPRDRMAELVDVLREHYNPKVVAFDVVFADEVQNTAIETLAEVEAALSDSEESQAIRATIAEAKRNADRDRILAESLKQAPFVVQGYFFMVEKETHGLLESDYLGGVPYLKPSEIIPRLGPDIELGGRFPGFPAVRVSLPELAKSSDAFGAFNIQPDPDSLYRHLPMLFVLREKLYPGLTLAALAKYYDTAPSALIGLDSVREERSKELLLSLDDKELTTVGDRGDFLVNFYGPAGTIPTYSIVQIMNRTLPKSALEGKLAYLGPTAIGIYDLRPTPFESQYPGVEIHASAAQNVIADDYLQRPGWMIGVETFLLIPLLGLLFGLIFARVKLQYGALALIIALLGGYYADINYVFGGGYWFKNIYPFIFLTIQFMVVAVYRYFTEEREKAMVKNAFGRFVATSVVNEMLRDTTKLKLGGERKELSVLFSDIRGFTSVSEVLEPVALCNLLNEYLSPMTEIVIENRGTLDKYMGDAVMAFWGAPLDDQAHARAAAESALQMMEELAILQKSWRERGVPPLDIGIGINTGFMSVGNMGSEGRFDYTVLGDAVNLGARLEGLNKGYGTHIIVSDYTREALGDDFHTRELDLVAVKGKKEPVKIFELVGRGEPEPKVRAWIDGFEGGIALFRSRQWDAAIETFQQILQVRPEDVSAELYIQRCEAFKIDPPPPDWIGVDVKTTK